WWCVARDLSDGLPVAQERLIDYFGLDHVVPPAGPSKDGPGYCQALRASAIHWLRKPRQWRASCTRPLRRWSMTMRLTVRAWRIISCLIMSVSPVVVA